MVCLWEIPNDLKLQKELRTDISQSGIELEYLAFSDDMTTNGFPRLLYSLLYEVLMLKGPAPTLFYEPGECTKLQGQLIEPGTMIIAKLRTFGEEAASDPVRRGPRAMLPPLLAHPSEWDLWERWWAVSSEPVQQTLPMHAFWAWSVCVYWRSVGKGRSDDRIILHTAKAKV